MADEPLFDTSLDNFLRDWSRRMRQITNDKQELSAMQKCVADLLAEKGIRADPYSIYPVSVEEPGMIQSGDQTTISLSFTYQEGKEQL